DSERKYGSFILNNDQTLYAYVGGGSGSCQGGGGAGAPGGNAGSSAPAGFYFGTRRDNNTAVGVGYPGRGLQGGNGHGNAGGGGGFGSGGGAPSGAAGGSNGGNGSSGGGYSGGLGANNWATDTTLNVNAGKIRPHTTLNQCSQGGNAGLIILNYIPPDDVCRL
ncbi:MAG: hypothetical protein FWE93_06475, partial [Alphaproteobacteria bacterium]|nr:hypothetical protein [Alphaproteobacteria bacterium]